MTTVGIPILPERLAERYEVGPVIGRGIGSSVFRAHDNLLGRDAAVKTFRVEADPRAGRELRLLARMDHPGLVPVYDVEEHEGRAFVVMALLDGGSLASRLTPEGGDPDGLPLAEALRTGGTVAGALDHVHRAGVLHRAVSPANVLYDGDGRAHLSDFGVAFVADAPRITDTGLTVGAAPYLAPEQVRGEHAGAGADVYALGLVLIEALTGRRAFPGDPLSSAQARLDRDPTIPRGLPAEVGRLLAAMTAGAPDDRPDAAGASVALRRALVDAEPLTMPSVIVGPSTLGSPSVLGGLALTSGSAAALTSGPAVTAPGPAGAWSSRLSPTRRRGTPRATGTRGILVLAGLAASAVLAGTVALAGTGPVAEITADSARPAAIVPGGATVGAPDPHSFAPEPAAPPASGDPAPSDESSAAPVTTRAPRTEQAPVREVASPTRETTTPRATTSSTTKPTRTTTPDADEPDDTTTRAPKPQDPVGGVLKGVGGLVNGVLGGGHQPAQR